MSTASPASLRPYSRRLLMLGAIWAVGLILSGRGPSDRATWWMEVAPVFIVYPLLWRTRGWPLTGLALALVALHGLVLMTGGHYTYAKVPLGFAIGDWLHLARNPFDRLGHFLQGLVPAIVLREWLIRSGAIRRGAFLSVTILAFCLAISAAYELIEFAAAQTLGQGADAFLGTQGDPWDTQWDMLTCLVGAAVALLTLSRLDDRLMGAVVPVAGAGHGHPAQPGE